MGTEDTITVDFSYKANARHCVYDIECLPSVFTTAFLCGDVATLWFFGNDTYDHISDDELKRQFKSYLDVEDHFERAAVKNPVIKLERFTKQNKFEFMRALSSVINCEALPTDDETGFTEYVSWNGSQYDLLVLIAIYRWCVEKPDITPLNIRTISDVIINFEGADWQLPEYLEKTIGLNKRNYKYAYNMAIWADGHIDIAKMQRVGEDGTEGQFPPALKLQEARQGADIVVDDLVSDSNPDQVIPDDELKGFVAYNLHDVVSTAYEYRTDDVQDKINVRDNVREQFPYTSARAADISTLYNSRAPLERDCTEAQLTATTLIGEKKLRPVDNAETEYNFPVPAKGEFDEDGNQLYKMVDFLEYIKEHEEYVHPQFIKFFEYWRGKNTSSLSDLKSAKYGAIKANVSSKGTICNIPYYHKVGDEYIPIDSYITVSTGGAHGSVWTGLHELTPEQVTAWSMACKKPTKTDKLKHVPTLDLNNVIHLDYTSFYPYLLLKRQTFITPDGKDRYRIIYDTRVGVKAELKKHEDVSKWTEHEYRLSNNQLGLKLQLNAGSGAANTHKKNALLPLDNKILSMRLIGNMAIWTLAQRMVHAGAYVVSTNTDGIYITNISKETARLVLDKFVEDYGIPVDPEYVDRFINRDVSNRMELYKQRDGSYTINDLRGEMRSAGKLVYNDIDHGHKITYPLAVGNAVIRYMVNDVDWNNKPYDRERMLKILNEVKQESTPIAWCYIFSGTSVRKLWVDMKEAPRVGRVVLTKDGYQLDQENYASLTNAEFERLIENFTPGCNFEELCKKSDVTFKYRNFPDISDVSFAVKHSAETKYDEDSFVSMEWGAITEEAYNQAKNKVGKREKYSVCLIHRCGRTERVEMKSWTFGKLANVPEGSKGRLLNMAAELKAFNLDDLDMDAYLAWAENMLARWKISAKLSEDGYLTQVLFNELGNKATSAKSKKQLAVDELKSLYSAVFNYV